MSTSNFTEFNLPRNAYAAFDAVSLKQLIINRVKQSGLFPDIDFEGSNINGIADIVAYSYHVLLFYLNQVAADSQFNQADLLENMNKIVSLIGYKPTGNHTASLNFDVTAESGLSGPASYTIGRFSNISFRNVPYSINRDITFQKTNTSDEAIESIGSNNLLYQGVFKEYPKYTAIGENFEIFPLNIDYDTVNDNKFVDHTNIFIFVKDVNTQVWSEWYEVQSLYNASNITTGYEKRLNEYGHYEIKFGNDINGRKLNSGDTVVIYYLESDGSKGIVGSGVASEGRMILFNSNTFSDIFDDIKNPNSNYIIPEDVRNLKFNNKYSSVPPTFLESVDSIRKNAPAIFASQNRAVTVGDYEAIVNKNFSNVIHDVKAVGNKEYTKTYLSYFYELGLEKPNLDDKILFNQVSFSDSCDFNNVYLFCVPKLGAIIDETTPNELFFAQKQSIVDRLDQVKMINQNVIISDPVYIAFDIGLPNSSETLTSLVREETVLRITRSTEELISKDQIKSVVFDLIKTFFLQDNNKLGSVLDINQLSFDLLNVTGVKSIETVRKVNSVDINKTNKLSLVLWNPLYQSTSLSTTTQNVSLDYYQFPFFYEISKLINKIEVV